MVTFLLVTLGIAVVIVLVWQRGRSSGAATGFRRLAIAWLGVVVVSGLLLAAWGIVALHYLDGFNR